jgi:hypothetical protein
LIAKALIHRSSNRRNESGRFQHKNEAAQRNGQVLPHQACSEGPK